MWTVFEDISCHLLGVGCVACNNFNYKASWELLEVNVDLSALLDFAIAGEVSFQTNLSLCKCGHTMLHFSTKLGS